MDQQLQEPKELPAFETAAEALFELEVFVDLCWAGMAYAEFATQMPSAKKAMARAGPALTGHARHVERAKKLEFFAAQQRPNGFPYLYHVAVTRLWSILEAYVLEIFVSVVLSKPEVRDSPRMRKLKGPLVDFADAPRERQAEFLYGLSMQELDGPPKRGVGRFETVLDAIGLGGSTEGIVERLLIEVSEIRHAVVHRRGIADDRLVAACPWSGFNPWDGFKVGEPIKIIPPQFEMYIFAAYWYIIEISRRVLTRYPPSGDTYTTEEKHRSVQAGIAAWLTQRLKPAQ